MYDGVIQDLIDELGQLPGIGPKSAQRIAFHLLDADPEALSALMPRVQKIGRAAVAALKADGLTLMQFSEAPAGQTVFHLHIHIVPRFDGVALGRHTGGMADSDLLGIHAAQIRAALDAA